MRFDTSSNKGNKSGRRCSAKLRNSERTSTLLPTSWNANGSKARGPQAVLSSKR